MPLQVIENEFWQIGILPETGSSTAFGRVRRGESWLDVMRPTAASDYGNSSNCASFIMLPWANRIRAGQFRFNGVDYQLELSSGDGTAIHGAARKLAWQVVHADQTRIVNSFDSADYEQINFPFKFSARAEFWLEGVDFRMRLTLTNDDRQPFPAGFGHHPYFVRDPENRVQLQIDCDTYYEMQEAMAVAPAVPLTPRLDFRQLRPLNTDEFNDVYTARTAEAAYRIAYPPVSVAMLADPLFQHVVLYTPLGKPFFAVEPQTNANDGFNLFDQGMAGTGVFVLQPGESNSGDVTLRIEA